MNVADFMYTVDIRLGEPKLFDTCEAAGKWVDKHNYKGNTVRYVIEMR